MGSPGLSDHAAIKPSEREHEEQHGSTDAKDISLEEFCWKSKKYKELGAPSTCFISQGRQGDEDARELGLR